ncbi:MAG: alanine racemase [Bacteroidota bacterium]
MTLTQPTLLLDEERCRKNIKKMADKARKHGLVFRPHFKTHQSLEIGRWFKEYGVEKITVSSVAMADYFSEEWDDITIAFPTNILEMEAINRLAQAITLNLLVESIEVVRYLGKHLKAKVGVFIKIDVGYQRTGIAPDAKDKIDSIISLITSFPKLDFKGFLGHAGHTYHCRDVDAVKEIHRQSLQHIHLLKAKYPQAVISLGDTPSCSLADEYEGVDEIRPGNFVFYDLVQHQIGSNTLEEISLALACPIVALHPERNEVIVYGGGVHFSKDRLEDEVHGTLFGRVVEQHGKGWGKAIPNVYVSKLSQEHGTIVLPEIEIQKYQIGDLLLVLPVHACMTAHAMHAYHTLDGQIISRL